MDIKSTVTNSRNAAVRVRTAKGRKLSSTNWLKRQLNDPYVIAAKREGYRSRAAYKLIEIDQKFDILSKARKIVDLGAAPGGWTQVVVERLQKKSNKFSVVGVDLQEVEPIPGATLLQGNFMEEETVKQIEGLLEGKIDLVMSDMAASSSGHNATDHWKIMALCEEAYYFAKDNLKVGGSFIAKILRGGTENNLLADIKQHFHKVKHFKPQSSRADSSESYIVAIGFKGINDDENMGSD